MPSSAASSWPWPASSRGEGTSSPASPHRHRVRPRPSPPRVSVKRALALHVGPAAGGPSVPALALLPNGKHLFGLGEIRFHMETTDGAPEEGWGCGDGHRVGRGAGLPGRSPRRSYTGFPKQKGSWCRERGAASAAGGGGTRPPRRVSPPSVQGGREGVRAKANAIALSPSLRSLDGSWKRGGRVARAGGDVQLLLPGAQAAHPGERGRARDPRRRALWEVGAPRPDRDRTAVRARPARRP